MAVETLSWADQTTAPDEQLADFSGQVWTSTEGGGAGTVEVTATLLGGVSSDVNSNADVNPTAFVYGGYTYTDTQLNNTGELYRVYDPGAGAVVAGANYVGAGGPDYSALVLRNLEEDNSSPAGFSHTVSLQLEFNTNSMGTYDDGVDNLNFWISDIDTEFGIDRVSIVAYGLDGTQIDPTDIVFSSPGGNVSTSYTADRAVLVTNGGTTTDDSQAGAVHVSVSVPISRIVVNYFNLGTGTQHITISDLTFEPILAALCFALGTRIRTPHGEVPIEDLLEGDRVTTSRGVALPIIWIGRSTVWASGEMAPVCVAKGTLGNTRDLVLSPAHRLLLSGPRIKILFGQDEVFAPASALVDGDRIYRLPARRITYFHILLETHEIIFAEGTPAESLLLTADSFNTLDHTARAEVLRLFPEMHGAGGDHRVVRPILNMPEIGLLKI